MMSLISQDNTHVQIKIYQEFYHCILYKANEGHHMRIHSHSILKMNVGKLSPYIEFVGALFHNIF